MTAAGSAGEAVTPGQAALKLAFENWLGSQGYDEDGMFDADEMEFAFEAGAEAERDLAQAAIAAATEGTLRACGYTLADAGRFLEAEFAPHAAIAAQQPPAVPESVPWRQGRTQPRNIYARTGGGDWKADLMIGQLDTPAAAAEAVRAHNAALGEQPAPELAAAMRETAEVRDGYAKLCEEFSDSPQSGQSARISLTVLNRHRMRAGLEALKPRRTGLT